MLLFVIVIYFFGGDNGFLDLCKECEVNLGLKVFIFKFLGLVNINFCIYLLLY